MDALLDRIADAKIVMLGEASHGTHEYYATRADLTRQLVADHGFSFVAVEGDWPDCERIDRSVRAEPDAPADPRVALEQFRRWPTWMWANEDVCDFARWLRGHNASRGTAVGFHGLDVYSLWESLRAVMLHLREHDPDLVEDALDAYRCFEPYGEDPPAYALATRFVPGGCEDEVVDLLVRLRTDTVDDLSLIQNAEVVAGAERYYRALVAGGGESWNVRDIHMADTLDRLLDHYGPDAKGIVWAHNTHVGDAQATSMATAGMVNIGQLARERYGRDEVALVGFAGHRGTVLAGSFWGAPMEVMEVPPAQPGSLEDVLHDTAAERAAFVFPADIPGEDGTLGHRAIGVVYDPDRERPNYVPTRLRERYDALCWFDETTALRPIAVAAVEADEPETFPTGV